MTANRETCKVQGAYAGEETREYQNGLGETIKVFNRIYANGEHTIFTIGDKVVMIEKTDEVGNEGEFIQKNIERFI